MPPDLCPQCEHSSIPPGANYCPNCGNPIGTDSTAMTGESPGGIDPVPDRLIEDQFKARALDEADIGLTITDTEAPSRPIIYANDAFLDMTGYTSEDLIGNNRRILRGPDTDTDRVHQIEQAVEEGQSTTVEILNYRKDNTSFWNLVRIRPMARSTGGSRYYLDIHLDITERKKRERKLEQYRAMTEVANDVIVTIDDTSHIRSINPAVEDLFGYSPGEVIGEELTLLMPERFREQHRQGIRRYLETEERKLEWDDVVFAGQHRDGSQVPLSISFSEVKYGGEHYFTGVIRDISERKAQEQELERAKQKLEQLLGRITDAFFSVDRDWNFTYWNKQAEEMIGRSSEELLGKNIWEEFPEAAETKVYDHYHRAMEDQETKHFEYFHEPLEIWLRISAYPSEQGLSVIFRDITERKRAEEALKESQRRFRALAENIDDILYLYDADYSEVLYLNKAYEAIWGRSREEVIEAPWEFSKYIHEADRNEIVSNKQSFLDDDSADQRIDQYRIIRSNGADRWVRDKMFKVRDDTGSVVHVAGIVSDETEQRELEQKLRDRQRQLNMALDAADAGVWTWNPQTGEETWIENYRRLFGLGESIQATHENFLQRVHPEDRDQLKEKMARARELSSNFIHEFRIQREGETRWIQSRGQVISSDDDSSPRVIGIDLDITEQKQLQRELEEAVEERDTLIQEVHHRVKNNLQMIISLIRLQLREMEVSETVASSFKDLENRIYTTALIHEQVYRKASLSNINVRDYLRELAEHVIRSQSSAEEVELVTNLEPIDLSIEKLLPCGLVINELLTNALQHGFEDRNEGRVELEFHRLDDSGYELIVADDGVGWQADSSFEDVQSLGMTLVKNLVRKQLHGSIYMTEKAEGVRFRIVIPGEQE